ncbi:hypothetical protein HMPREF0178_00408 [Bilophila sp. 4_1_30]|uniref:helix-turn-helix domain-containing protein n=1 Tax=Bilophila sp. 4_1_30 TaxID=693988 RepID=UPI0002238DE0|nr:helix-turn-helix domain-containing protein [Bilophila sp. 4_1_30]EGW42911.1 hypothetical protein HMPREF0178_00408 [Bilophila sp. 4_1_30]
MERHEFDAAYARICEVCGMKTQTELSAYLGIRQSSISDAKRRVAVPAAWLLTLLTREGVNPTWILTGGGSKFLFRPRCLRARPRCCWLVWQGRSWSSASGRG